MGDPIDARIGRDANSERETGDGFPRFGFSPPRRIAGGAADG
jgi:hypothetical protein